MKRRKFIHTAAYAGSLMAIGNRAMGQEENASGPFELPPLPYAEDALAPHIDAQTMGIHHGKHHAGYTRNLNTALEGVADFKDASIESILARLPEVADASVQTALRNNGGGFYNHRLFWEIMAPEKKTGKLSAPLSKAIDQNFGSMEKFQEAFTKAASSQFGSGWAWLSVQGDKLIVTGTPNQDNPLMKGIVADEHLGVPILGVDVWEHAYYLNYQNRRGDYLGAWWNVVNWDRVSENFDRASG